MLRGTNYTINQRLDASHAFYYQRNLGQNDVNSAEDRNCTMSGHNYIGIICFTRLLTLMSSQTHMTPLEHKRRNLKESLLLGVVLHRINVNENAVNPEKLTKAA